MLPETSTSPKNVSLIKCINKQYNMIQQGKLNKSNMMHMFDK